jgi:hypothetical protein
MAAIITEQFRKHNAEQFFESFSEAAKSTYYLFLGKSSPYTETNDGAGNTDTNPPAPNDDVVVPYYNWDAMLASKIVSTSNVSYVVPRRNWTNSTAYDMYEHDISSSNTTNVSSKANLYDGTYYFMTTDYKVYKILDNNNGAVYSGAEPTATSTTPFFLGGYYLQYLYTLTTSDVQTFLTNDFLPVKVDSTVSGAATDGKVHVVRSIAGSGYTNGTYYTPIKGDGASGVVKIIIASGAIAAFGSSSSTSTEVFNGGTGYTYGTINLTDVYSDSALSTSTTVGAGTGGSISIVVAPKGGSGFNAIEELGGHYVMITTKFEQADGDDVTVANDFRQVGILKDPYNYGTATICTATTRRQTYAVKLASAPSTSYTIDEKITQATSGAVGKVVEFDSSNNIIYYNQERFVGYGTATNGSYTAFTGTDTITGDTSTGAGTPSSTASETITLTGGNTIAFTSGYAFPEMDPDSGKLLYVENRRPISRASDQSEDIKIVVEF